MKASRWVGLVVMAVVVGWAGLQIWPAGHTPAMPGPTKTASPLPVATPALDPIQIEAIRARAYPGSNITQTQDLGTVAGGAHNTVVSFVSDGLTEYALMSTPAGSAPAGGWPVVILLHGYIDPAAYSTTGTEYRSYITAFTAAGYVVIKPDFRGHGASQGEASGGHFSPAYTYDTLNLMASIKQTSNLNPARIGLFGHSLGGHVALRTAVASANVKATVIMAGVVGSIYDLLYNWPRSPMPNDRPVAVVSGARQALIAKYGDPKANPAFWESASAINYVKYISGAVQIHHDTLDSTVPVSFSRSLEAALKAANIPQEAYYYEGDDHQFSSFQSLLLSRTVAFYKARL